jgi:c-di-GMP-binding flagellar brake protein YcgR
MSDETEEKREYTRAYFTRKDSISATIQTHSESQVSLPVTILSISAGGLSFFCTREKVLTIIKEGDQLTVTDIQTPQPLGPIASLGVEVKYIQDYESNDRMGFGCNFTKISDALRNKIQSFIESRSGSKSSKDK